MTSTKKRSSAPASSLIRRSERSYSPSGRRGVDFSAQRLELAVELDFGVVTQVLGVEGLRRLLPQDVLDALRRLDDGDELILLAHAVDGIDARLEIRQVQAAERERGLDLVVGEALEAEDVAQAVEEERPQVLSRSPPPSASVDRHRAPRRAWQRLEGRV
jgi:hypothetical protein